MATKTFTKRIKGGTIVKGRVNPRYTRIEYFKPDKRKKRKKYKRRRGGHPAFR